MSITVQHRRDSRANIEAVTPADGELGWDQTLKTFRGGDGVTLGGYLMKKWRYAHPISPAQIVADQNNYSPTDLSIAETLLLTTDAARSITGIAAGVAGSRMAIVNRGSFDITLKNSDAGSTAANRFLFDADVVIRARGSVELQYSGTDSRWMLAGGAMKLSTVPQELLLPGVITPAQITANQNNYAPADSVTATKTTALASTLRLSSDASRNITGLVDPREGVLKTLVNVGTNPIVLKNQDGGSTAANRFDFGADVTLAGKQVATLRYDTGDSRWKLLASTAGAAVAAGSVTAQTLAASALGVSMINGTLVPSVAGNALTLAIKTLAGTDPSAADPVFVVFRDATAANGNFNVRTLTAATSLTVSSGSSLGSINGTPFKIWIVAFDDGGTFRLGVINCLSGQDIYPLGGFGLATSTAEGGAGGADNALTFYTGAAVAASAAYATLGYMAWEGGLAAAGTWSAGPTRSQLFGPGVPLPGDVVTKVRAGVGVVSTGTTVIPFDNTVPQSTEGDQVISKSINLTSAAHLLAVRAVLNLNAATVVTLCAALFRDSGASAIAAGFGLPAAGLPLEYVALAGSAGATSLKIRVGPSGATTWVLNGSAGGSQWFGGSLASFLELQEIAT